MILYYTQRYKWHLAKGEYSFMTRKVYQDYLTHLDAYLLNGVSEIGGIPQDQNEIDLIPSLGNINSNLFVLHEGPAYHNNVAFLSEDESTSLLKILNSIDHTLENTYATCIHKTNQLNQQELKKLVFKELESSPAKIVLCLGVNVFQFLLEDKTKTYEKLDQWEDLTISGRTIKVVTIPSLSEMKADPALKRPAWEQLKKIK